MSNTATIYTLTAALNQVEVFLGTNLTWHASSTAQSRLLSDYFATARHEPPLPDIESIAAHNEEPINAFLRDRDFTIQLLPFTAPDIGVASVLDLTVSWFTPGKQVPLHTAQDTIVSGVHLKEHVTFYTAPDHPEPLVALATQSEDTVWLTMLADSLDGFDLLERAMTLRRTASLADGMEVIFPMVDLDREVDLSWLLGLSATHQDALVGVISQALQQTKLKLDERGAHVKDAVAIVLTRGLSARPRPYLIDRPFLIWIERPGYQYPLFAGYITEEHWRNPQRGA